MRISGELTKCRFLGLTPIRSWRVGKVQVFLMQKEDPTLLTPSSLTPVERPLETHLLQGPGWLGASPAPRLPNVRPERHVEPSPDQQTGGERRARRAPPGPPRSPAGLCGLPQGSSRTDRRTSTPREMAHTAFPYRNVERQDNHPSGLALLWPISRLQAQPLGALKCYPSEPRSCSHIEINCPDSV